MAEITINQEYIVKINATTETELTDEEIKNLIPTLPEVLKELITEEITDGVGTVDVEPVKYGHWSRKLIYNKFDSCIGSMMICSECNKDNKYDKCMDYCPNCGAKMDGEEVQV